GRADGGAGATWRVVHENTLGELEMRILLEELLGPGAGNVAAGWDGDRFRVLEGSGGQRALVWYSVWDDDARADGFARSYRRVLEGRTGWTGDVARVTVGGRPLVRVRAWTGAHAPADPGVAELHEEER
ncbi:MAG TPA: hypothetical protein VMK65_13830, partial [Longimicrobiales bacterium]|nr:hypothetical protein [Longimicrobiales bacterium]